MYVFEAFSLLLNAVLIISVIVKGQLIKGIISDKASTVILWIFFGLFVLNTIGNFLAVTNFERYFAILTLTSCVLIWIILKKEPTDPERNSTQ